MFELDNYLPPPSNNNKQYQGAACETRDKPFKDDDICKSIKGSLPTVMQNKVKQNYFYCFTFPSEYWIDIIGTLEDRNNRMHVSFGQQNPSAKKKNKKVNHYIDTDSDRDSRSSVPLKKKRPIPGKGSQKTASHHIVQCYFVLYNNPYYPYLRYKSYSSQQCRICSTPENTNKDLYGSLFKHDAAVKQFRKVQKNIQKHQNALNKHNKLLYNVSNKLFPSGICTRLRISNLAMNPLIGVAFSLVIMVFTPLSCPLVTDTIISP